MERWRRLLRGRMPYVEIEQGDKFSLLDALYRLYRSTMLNAALQTECYSVANPARETL